VEDTHEETLTTERLHLRAFVTDDAAEVQRLVGDARIAATTARIPHPYEDGMAEAWIATHAAGRESGRELVWAVTGEADGALLGAVGLRIEAAHARGTLGYWIGVPYWGRGFATEATRAVLGVAFERLALHRVQAEHLACNPASGCVMRKIGLRHEGTLRDHVRHGEGFDDMERYGLLRGDRERDSSSADDGRPTPTTWTATPDPLQG